MEGGARPDDSPGTFVAADGAGLFCRLWEASEETAVMVLVHGLGEHSGRYARLARALSQSGCTVFAFDLRGHGHSPGRRGDVEGFDALLSDLSSFREHVRRRTPDDRPLFLLGHSLGGLIALRSIQEQPDAGWAGVILSSPALGIGMAVPAWKRAAARLLLRLAPWATVNNGILAEDLSREPYEVAAYRDDPLVHGQISARLYHALQAEPLHAVSRLDAVRVPAMLWLIPMDDRVCDSSASLAAVDRLPDGVESEVRRYPGAFHETLNDTCGEQVVEDVVGWISGRTT